MHLWLSTLITCLDNLSSALSCLDKLISRSTNKGEYSGGSWLPYYSYFNFNLFIKQKDRSATYIGMHEIHVETLLNTHVYQIQNTM